MQVRPRYVFFRTVPIGTECRLAEKGRFGWHLVRGHRNEDARACRQVERLDGTDIAVGIDFSVEYPMHDMRLLESRVFVHPRVPQRVEVEVDQTLREKGSRPGQRLVDGG